MPASGMMLSDAAFVTALVDTTDALPVSIAKLTVTEYAVHFLRTWP